MDNERGGSLDDSSVHLHSDDFQNSFEFRIAVKGNLQNPLSLGVPKLDFSAKALAKLILKPGQLRIFRRRQRGGFGGGRVVTQLQMGDESLRLADVKSVFENTFGGNLLRSFAGQPKDNFGVAH